VFELWIIENTLKEIERILKKVNEFSEKGIKISNYKGIN
jgi:hypothetical protein